MTTSSPVAISGWMIVGASIFASNIGSEHLVGLAGSGATSGVALAHFELHAWCLLVLGWVLVPFYMRTRVYTTPEFLERRFSETSRWVLSIISLVAYVLTKIAVGIFAGGIVFGTLLPELQVQIGGTVFNSFWVGSVVIILLTGLYTVVGGMRAVAYTEALQTVVLVLGSLLLTSSACGCSAAGESCARRSIPTCSTSGSRWCPRAWSAPGRR
jgi:solute:Na+ symporter, SSS family